jgi:hypothetical protein
MNSAGKTLQLAEEDCTVKLATCTTMEIFLEIKEYDSLQAWKRRRGLTMFW